MNHWDRKKVSELESDELVRLRSNANRLGATELITWCDDELSTRNIKTKTTGRSVKPDDEKNAEAEADAELRILAARLSARHDLSTETAKRISDGVKGFRAVSLLGKNRTAKVGGPQLKGTQALDRYISYRLRDDRLSLAYVHLKDRPINEARWVVVGPRRLLPQATPIIQQWPELGEVNAGYRDAVGLVSDDFQDAAGIFESVIQEIGPLRDEGDAVAVN